MVRTCELKTLGRCASKYSEGGVSFFRFPVEHGVLQDWCRNLLWPDSRPVPEKAVLCHYHFHPEEDFTRSAKRRRLLRNAVPYDTVRKNVQKWCYTFVNLEIHGTDFKNSNSSTSLQS